MERAVLAREALADDLCVLVDQDGHGLLSQRCGSAAACALEEGLKREGEPTGRTDTAMTGHRHPRPPLPIFWAASSRSAAEVTLRLDFAMIVWPSSTFVPSSRTTSGPRRPPSFTAATTPSAMTSHFMMPP